MKMLLKKWTMRLWSWVSYAYQWFKGVFKRQIILAFPEKRSHALFLFFYWVKGQYCPLISFVYTWTTAIPLRFHGCYQRVPLPFSSLLKPFFPYHCTFSTNGKRLKLQRPTRSRETGGNQWYLKTTSLEEFLNFINCFYLP